METIEEGPKKNKRELKRVGENLYTRNGVYYAIVKVNGKQTWKALDDAFDRNTARAERDKLKDKMQLAGPISDRSQIPTFEDAVDQMIGDCKKRGMKARSLESLESHMNVAKESLLCGMKISAIRKNHIQQYLDGRFKDRSGRTVNLDLIHLRRLFRYAVTDRKWRWDNPTTGIACYPHEEREVPVPTQAEIGKVIVALRIMPIRGGKKAADFVQFLQLSGLRLEEAQHALRNKVNFAKNFLEVKGKGDKWRIIDLFPNLRSFLQSLLEKPGDHERIFPPCKGVVYDPRNALALGCRGAEVRPFGFHGLRHAWATRLVELGLDFATIAKWMGHEDGGILVATRYGKHSRREHFQAVAKKVTIGDAPPTESPGAVAEPPVSVAA